ncbi:hypothetical protein TRFO_38650 [Tritrichomonas foetus]|uniref:Ubiquitin-like domain-containing protein n=1 Tax=Tritrichomonas foetus TaxID=1144522 RepID=A0A1J4J7C9_9EUKA|nr:hypothetical protein TRFO_38650 [Tritrichomonas foetus]|eukprot:OHS95130.1 hypothetical protein TRFO_38650 [Tritrichomonas foetus]
MVKILFYMSATFTFINERKQTITIRGNNQMTVAEAKRKIESEQPGISFDEIKIFDKSNLLTDQKLIALYEGPLLVAFRKTVMPIKETPSSSDKMEEVEIYVPPNIDTRNLVDILFISVIRKKYIIRVPQNSTIRDLKEYANHFNNGRYSRTGIKLRPTHSAISNKHHDNSSEKIKKEYQDDMPITALEDNKLIISAASKTMGKKNNVFPPPPPSPPKNIHLHSKQVVSHISNDNELTNSIETQSTIQVEKNNNRNEKQYNDNNEEQYNDNNEEQYNDNNEEQYNDNNEEQYIDNNEEQYNDNNEEQYNDNNEEQQNKIQQHNDEYESQFSENITGNDKDEGHFRGNYENHASDISLSNDFFKMVNNSMRQNPREFIQIIELAAKNNLNEAQQLKKEYKKIYHHFKIKLTREISEQIEKTDLNKIYQDAKKKTFSTSDKNNYYNSSLSLNITNNINNNNRSYNNNMNHNNTTETSNNDYHNNIHNLSANNSSNNQNNQNMNHQTMNNDEKNENDSNSSQAVLQKNPIIEPPPSDFTHSGNPFGPPPRRPPQQQQPQSQPSVRTNTDPTSSQTRTWQDVYNNFSPEQKQAINNIKSRRPGLDISEITGLLDSCDGNIELFENLVNSLP